MIKIKEKFLEKNGQNGEELVALVFAINVILLSMLIHPHFLIVLPAIFLLICLFGLIQLLVCFKEDGNYAGFIRELLFILLEIVISIVAVTAIVWIF